MLRIKEFKNNSVSDNMSNFDPVRKYMKKSEKTISLHSFLYLLVKRYFVQVSGYVQYRPQYRTD